jgi:catalase
MAKSPGLSKLLGNFPVSNVAAIAALAGIGVVVAGAAAAFSYTAGWLSPDRLTPTRLVDTLSKLGGDPLGHRRNHAKGICFTGEFEANGAGAAFSKAPMFLTGHYPVIGRLAIATQSPGAADQTGRVRSMAFRITAPDGQEWRSGMNDIPFFPVATPAAFYDSLQINLPDPATGKPDPAAGPRFVGAHPEFLPFLQWLNTAPWTSSFVDQAYNSLNAFTFVDAGGTRRAVRWSMQPTLPPQLSTPADLAKLGPNFLEQDLVDRLKQGTLTWHMVVTVAAPGDPTNDATKAWPDDRQHATVGDLVIHSAQAEADGPCRDFNYDPLILPAGIEPSDDPLLPARSSAYAVSFDRRTAEASHYSRTPAPGTPGQ